MGEGGDGEDFGGGGWGAGGVDFDGAGEVHYLGGC